MSRLLADTSAWIEFLRPRGDEGIRARLRDALQAGTVVLCEMVLLELWNGTPGSRQVRLLETLETTLERVPLDDHVWSEARGLARRSRREGLTIPPSDLLIFATARVHELELLHNDAHFDDLEKLAKAGA